MPRAAMWCLAAVLCLAATPVAAQGNAAGSAPSDAERAAAQVLFDEGRALVEKEDWETACEKFAESMRLDRALGTQLNLANCYEHIGKTASAWINYVEAASRAAKANQPRRVAIAKKRVKALEPELSRLSIEIAEDVDGLVVKRDGDILGSAQHNLPVPVDPGTHRIEVSAPGKRTWRKKVKVSVAQTTAVKVPPLRDAPIAPKPDPAPGDTDAANDGSGMRAAAYVMTGVGVLGLTAGIVGGALAISRNDSSLKRCLPDDAQRCISQGVALREDAFNFSYMSTAGFAAAGAGFVTALVLLVAAPTDHSDDNGDDEAEPTDVARQWQLIPTFDAVNGQPRGLSFKGVF